MNKLKKYTALPIILGLAVAGLLLKDEPMRFLAVFLICAVPIFYYLFQKPFVSILKWVLVIMFFVPFQFYDFLNPMKVLNPLVILGIILAIKLFYAKRNVLCKFTIIDRLYFIFLISAFISSSRAINILGSLNWIFYSVTTGYVVYRAIMILNIQEGKDLLRFLIFAASLSALYGIKEYIAGNSLIYGWSIPDRLTSLLGHPVVNGLVFATVFPFSLVLYIETRKKVFIATSIILFLAIILTFARGSWLALAIGILTMFGYFRFRFKSRLLVTVIILVIFAGLMPAVKQAVVRRLNQSEIGRYSSFNVRKESFPIAISIIKDRLLFGGGPFNADRYKEKYAVDANFKETSFENTYLGLLVDLGIVGIGILFFFVMSIIKRTILSPWGSQGINAYRSGAIASFIILLINMATFNLDSYRLFHFIVWFYIGLAVFFAKSGAS